MTTSHLHTLGAALLIGLWLAPPAQARDEPLLFTVQGALATPAAKDRLDDTVQFFFGEQSYPEPLQQFGIFTVERKTSAMTKTDQEACDWVFLSALLALRDRAKEEGANAVVDIKGIYKNPYPMTSQEFNHYERGWTQSLKFDGGKLVEMSNKPAQLPVATPQAPTYNAYAELKGRSKPR